MKYHRFFFHFFYRTIIDYHVTSIILKFVVIKRSLRVKSILCAIKSEILKMPYLGKYSRTEVFFIDFKWMPKLSVQLNIYFPVIFTYNIHNRVFFLMLESSVVQTVRYVCGLIAYTLSSCC